MLLNGPPAAGKTTVGRRLAATARNGVCVHGDALRGFVIARERGAVAEELSYGGGAALVDVYLDGGYRLVVFEFVFRARRHVNRFLGALHVDVPVQLVTLWTDLETLEARERGRPGRERLGSRVAACREEVLPYRSELGRSSRQAARSTWCWVSSEQRYATERGCWSVDRQTFRAGALVTPPSPVAIERTFVLACSRASVPVQRLFQSDGRSAGRHRGAGGGHRGR